MLGAPRLTSGAADHNVDNVTPEYPYRRVGCMKKTEAVAGFQLFVKFETRRLFLERVRSPHLEFLENAFLGGTTVAGCECDTTSLARSMSGKLVVH